MRAGSAAARPAAARRDLATAAEEPETAPSQSAAEPWPALAYEPVSTTTGENKAMPEAAARSARANRSTIRRAWSPETDAGVGDTHQALQGAHGLLELVFEVRGRRRRRGRCAER